MRVTDDHIHRLCAQEPENCLRNQLAQAGDRAEKLNLIKTSGAYPYDRALHCLNREDDHYRGAGRPELYDERIAIHLNQSRGETRIGLG